MLRCLARALAMSKVLNADLWLSEGGYVPEPRLAVRKALEKVRRDRSLKLLAKALAALARVLGVVVDIGCGSGFVARYLKCLGVPTYVVCIDSDEAMARVSRDACDDFVVAKGEYLPIRRCNALCVSINAIHEMLSKALQELPKCKYVVIADIFAATSISIAIRDTLSKFIPRLTRYYVEVPLPLSRATNLMKRLGLEIVFMLKRSEELFIEAIIVARRLSELNRYR